MNTADLNDLHTVSARFYVEAERGDPTTLTLADPDTVVVRVLQPNGEVITPEPTRNGVGIYEVELSVSQSGIWRYRWEGTGAAADNGEGVFFVRPSGVVSG